MVLESIFPAAKIENKPVDMLILSILISFVSVFVAWWVFPASAGIVAPLLVTVAMTPVTYRILIHEEEVEAEEAENKIKETFWERHGEIIVLFALFFIGNFISIFVIALFAPQTFVESAFAQQLADIAAVSAISGAAVSGTSLLSPIIQNNLRVIIFAFALSFLFATGALFILSWNASILAIFLASLLRQGLYTTFIARTVGILPHAPIEMGAYFLAGIAGGMLSAGMIREKMNGPEFKLILRDSLALFAIGIAAIVLGGFVEVYL
jgi:uncharacterized membrane protein SpoIIM required for sporulation